MIALLVNLSLMIRRFSISSSLPCHISWNTEDFIKAHFAVKESGRFNFEVCKIPIPTKIRYDRMEAVLGLSSATNKEKQVLLLLKYGMPINCKPSFGVQKMQKNHFSAESHKQAVEEFLKKNIQSKAMLGPFKQNPIPNLCFSPFMTVPKEKCSRRIIVDFSFPPGNSINDGISKVSYLEFDIKFSLPSVQSMVSRLNDLGPGCLLYKRDLKGAFRQFATDPGDYSLTGVSWQGNIYLDTRLAMGLRSSAYCC